VLQKEYPSAHPLGKPRRQGWDIALIKTPLESNARAGKPAYDYLRLVAVVEFGMNETVEHLRDDLERLSHEAASVDRGFIVHLYRLSEPGAPFSGRDWSVNSSQILALEDVVEVARCINPGGNPVEIFYGLYDHTGRHPSGVWWITRDEVKRLDRALKPEQSAMGPISLTRIVLLSGDASPNSQRATAHQASQFYPRAKWVGRVRNAAKKLGTRFHILTTGHGLVAPNQVITPYNLHISTHQAQVEDCWRQTIPPLIDSERCDIVVFYAGGCPRDPYIELLRPILHEQGVALITFGKPNMCDSGKIEQFVELLATGTSTDELRSILRKPDKLLYFPVVDARQKPRAES